MTIDRPGVDRVGECRSGVPLMLLLCDAGPDIDEDRPSRGRLEHLREERAAAWNAKDDEAGPSRAADLQVRRRGRQLCRPTSRSVSAGRMPFVGTVGTFATKPVHN